MTSLIRQTGRNLFQQVCKYFPTHSGIHFLNCILNFFLQLCNASRSILIDYILEITPQKKVQRAHIWAIWWPLANLPPAPRNSTKKDTVSFSTCGHVFCCWKTMSHSSLYKINLKCWIIYRCTSAIIVVSKKVGPFKHLWLTAHQMPIF